MKEIKYLSITTYSHAAACFQFFASLSSDFDFHIWLTESAFDNAAAAVTTGGLKKGEEDEISVVTIVSSCPFFS